MLRVNKEKCNGDELCTTVCPVGAAQICESDNKACIDADTCIECFACINICPQQAIYEDD
ncbi:MAG: 4Fe-4S binding protein [Firmicutes bacterium]|nr:4Fe-4S binding protein [Bacillota bacterium]